MSQRGKVRIGGIAVGALAICAGLIAVIGPSAVGKSGGGKARAIESTSASAAFDVVQLRWEKPVSDPGEAVLSVAPGQDARLTKCGSGSWESSMLVLAPDGIAYCITPIDMSDHESLAAARIMGMKLATGDSYTDAELQVLRLQILAGESPEGSAEAAQYRLELDAAWEALTPAEYQHLTD